MNISLVQGNVVTEALKVCPRCKHKFLFGAVGYTEYVKMMATAWLFDYYGHLGECKYEGR